MAADHIKLLCDIGELSWIFSDTGSIESFLQRVVEMVAKHMDADVCSIYLYDEDQEQLVLTANVGLSPESIGNVKLRLDEGLTGLAMRESRTVCEKCGRDNPNFKFFAGIHEEHYDAFLAVPIIRGLSKIGVIAVQRGRERFFEQSDTLALRAVASQLASIVENARLLISIHEKPRPRQKARLVPTDLNFVKGQVASKGYAFGPATIIDKSKVLTVLMQRHFDRVYTKSELDEAIAKTQEQLWELQKQVEDKLSDVASLIFTAHLLILKDQAFVGTMRRLAEGGENAASAVLKVAKQYIEIFAGSNSTFVQEKVQDVQDLTLRLMRNLLKNESDTGSFEGRIVVAKELFPSDLLKMSSEKLAGVVLVSGGVTSHLSILARSLRIPMVIANKPEMLYIPERTPVLIDGEAGNVYVNPTEQIISTFKAREEAQKEFSRQRDVMTPETVTKDGTRIHLYSNINLLADVALANEMHSEGIGLYRTEFPFMIRSDFPSEEEQYVVYRKLVEQMRGKDVTFRTLDMGGDKVLSYYSNIKEENPFLGMRAIRFSLQNTAIFVAQIRAMLRAGAGLGPKMHIMFPMIGSVDEFEQAKGIVLECIGALQYEGIEHNNSPQIGMMVEIPSALDIIEDFADSADFFSIGTNDLIQYMLAVDRTNEKVASFYQPYHPSVLRAIKRIADAAKTYNKDVSVCGDMAHDERFLPFFIGIGIRKISVDSVYLPRLQKKARELSLGECCELAEQMLSLNKAQEILKLIESQQEPELLVQWPGN